MEDVVKSTDLVGTWRLVTWEAHPEGGTLTHPFGPDAVGYIIYTADGFVSATLMRSMRQAFRGGTMHSGTVDEKVAAIGSYVAYAGTYRRSPAKSPIIWWRACFQTGSAPTSSATSNGQTDDSS
jgi:hypothetical protein